MKFKYVIRYLLGMLICMSYVSCRKYLDKKPDKSLAIPSTIKDLQLLLDNYNLMNSRYPAASGIMSDNYYISSEDWSSLSLDIERDLYLWKRTNKTLAFWPDPYKVILQANVVLDRIKEIPTAKKDLTNYNNVKGSALFFRAYYFYALAQLYAPPYNLKTSSEDLGIPLRLNSDYNKTSKRSTLKETYNRIITDLKEAVTLLPIKPLLKSRPGKPAAYGELARTFLVMNQFDKAELYADSCLSLYDSLINYNTLNPNTNDPIKHFNKEVIFQARSLIRNILLPSKAKVGTNLYNSYQDDDLRKIIWFKEDGKGNYVFKGNYDGAGYYNGGYIFSGIVTDEIYLIRAECYARMGNTSLAIKDINTLLRSRWKTGKFNPVTASSSSEALSMILEERRKELIFRGTRWTDIRRLKDDPVFAVHPVRLINNQSYELTQYTLEIPIEVIKMTGMKQNP